MLLPVYCHLQLQPVSFGLGIIITYKVMATNTEHLLCISFQKLFNNFNYICLC